MIEFIFDVLSKRNQSIPKYHALLEIPLAPNFFKIEDNDLIAGSIADSAPNERATAFILKY